MLEKEREGVDGSVHAVAELRPGLQAVSLTKPLTMLLFGMINWMFTWMRPDGDLTNEDNSSVVSELFFGGLPVTTDSAFRI